MESRRVLDEDDDLTCIAGRMFTVVEESSNTVALRSFYHQERNNI